MSHFIDNAAQYNQPLRLTIAQRENPGEVLKELTVNFPLSDLRHYLFEMLECALTSESGIFDEPKERAAIIHFTESIEELFEAVYIIVQNKK